MKITKQSHYNSTSQNQGGYILAVDNDLVNIFNVIKGRVRFGDAVDGYRGENIAGEFKIFTTSGTPNAENTITHGLGAVPVGWLVVSKDKAGDLYAGTTTWTSTKLYLKCSVASVTYKIFLLK